MNKIFSQAWKYFAGGATILAYDAWYERIKTPHKTLEFQNEMKSYFSAVKDEISSLQEQLASNNCEETNRLISNKLMEFNNELNQLNGVQKDYFDRFEKGNISPDSQTSLDLYHTHKEKFDAAFSKVNDKANEIIDILDKTKDKFMDDNPIFNLISEFKEYLASLSTMEICLVINISSCVFILTCIISILFSISGNYLIEKFSLEQKFTKLSKIIQLRVKFQRYYIIINSVFIILAIFSLIFVNTITLING